MFHKNNSTETRGVRFEFNKSTIIPSMYNKCFLKGSEHITATIHVL